MKNKKALRLSAVILALLTVIASFPVLGLSVKAEVGEMTDGEWSYSIFYESGLITVTGYTGTATEVTFPTDLDGLAVKSIGENVFKDYKGTGVKEITLPDSVVEISQYAFAKCQTLESVNISAESKLEYIEGYAFQGCKLAQHNNSKWRDKHWRCCLPRLHEPSVYKYSGQRDGDRKQCLLRLLKP